MTVKLRVQSAMTQDFVPLDKWVPENPEEVKISIVLQVSTNTDDTTDTFRVVVATPRALLSIVPRAGIVAERPLVVVARYDPTVLWRWIEQTVKKCESSSREESIQELRRFFGWEYDGYDRIPPDRVR